MSLELNTSPWWPPHTDFHIELSAPLERKTSVLPVDRVSCCFLSLAASPLRPRLVRQRWFQAGRKARVSFDGTSHFSMQQSTLWELREEMSCGTCCSACLSWNDSSVIYHKTLGMKCRALRGEMNQPSRDNPTVSLLCQYKMCIHSFSMDTRRTKEQEASQES